jgi:hypothetical protein
MRSLTVPLEPGYRADFPRLSRDQWNELIADFSDASLYQTWDYEAIRCGERNISHLVLKHGEDTVAVAQVRLARLSGLPWGAAYVRWGPLWRRRDRPHCVEDLRMALRALRNEYVGRRGLVLRIFPLAFAGNGGPTPDLLVEERLVYAPNESPQQTILLDVEAPLSDLRKGFDQKWRNCLNHAERNSLIVTQGTANDLFADFIPLYRELVTRKKFTEPNDINEFRRIQASLPECYKMQIFLCRDKGILTAGAICSAIGNSGIYLFGATNEGGLKNKGAYLLQWHALQWVKNQGCQYYNLNGINPVKNPGGYHFKAGVGGKNRQEVRYLGRFDCYGGIARTKIVGMGLRTLPIIKRLIGTVNRSSCGLSLRS